MRMRSGDSRITIEAPRSEVWQLVERAENFGLWWPRQVVPIQGDGPITRGSVWDAPKSGMGPPLRTEVSELEPERKMVLGFWLSRSTRPVQVWTLELEDEATHCRVRLRQSMDWEMVYRQTYGSFAIVVLLLLLPLTFFYLVGFTISSYLRSNVYPFTLLSDLRKLKRAVEARRQP